jgi:hypothetical protein
MTVAKRELGQRGLQVTTLGYGAMELRGAPRARDITESQAETICNEVLDSGINYIDTSIDYGLARSGSAVTSRIGVPNIIWRGPSPGHSYGGYKQSGIGREVSLEGTLESFTHRKKVTVNLNTLRRQ